MRRDRTIVSRSSALLIAAALFGLVGTSAAQPPSAPIRIPDPSNSTTLNQAMRAEVIDSLTACVLREYVEADTARMIAREIRTQQEGGAYDQFTSPARFAEAVTRDLRRINGDLHLSLRYSPGGPGGGGPVVIGAGAPGDSAGSGPTLSRWFPSARRQNYGLSRVEVLPGNVGYLETRGFMEAPGMEEVMASALRFLERTDAVIIDVRENHGGSGGMSHLLFSHFLPAEPVPTIEVRSRASETPMIRHSLTDVPGPRRPDVPLYVLTSRGTGSAAEEFTFVLRNLGRATIVGERTAGAGHMVNAFDLPYGFVAGVSITRVSDPRTGLEWERVGVLPDLPVDADRALAAAHGAALRKLAGSADPDRRRELDWLAEWVESKERGAAVTAGQLSNFPGTYEGERAVTVGNGRLFFRRGPIAGELIPTGDGRFVLDGTARLTFSDGVPARSLTIERLDGSSSVCPRTGPAPE